MTLFRDELLTVQDEYLREDVLRVDPEDDDEVGYDNDDLGENTEVTPIGDDLDADDIDDSYMVSPEEDDDLLADDDDVLLDDDQLLDDDDEDVVDLHKISAVGGDEDDDLLDDDDDDDLDEIDPVEIDEEDDDLLADDDDDDFDDEDDLDDEDLTDDEEGSTTQGLNRSVNIDVPSRSTSRIIDHEPGTISPRDI
ncbi:hypothetical protein [Desertivirga brevis]|uniref:hypothetical protein n=1 Tax=Desertivirga brevis TaxID=2810310 RepID=UPI001A964949|nr:hypothetical protein [Pedobacter sp. SYSU D00873]